MPGPSELYDVGLVTEPYPDRSKLTEKGARFRALHSGPGAFVIANAWDAGSARLLLQLNLFPAIATSSAAAAMAQGLRDGLLGRDRSLANARAIVNACDPLPVSADLENGFSEPPGKVAETIRLAAAAGLVSASIEDAVEGHGPVYDRARGRAGRGGRRGGAIGRFRSADRTCREFHSRGRTWTTRSATACLRARGGRRTVRWATDPRGRARGLRRPTGSIYGRGSRPVLSRCRSRGRGRAANQPGGPHFIARRSGLVAAREVASLGTFTYTENSGRVERVIIVVDAY
jgi:hypothetical protein